MAKKAPFLADSHQNPWQMLIYIEFACYNSFWRYFTPIGTVSCQICHFTLTLWDFWPFWRKFQFFWHKCVSIFNRCPFLHANFTVLCQKRSSFWKWASFPCNEIPSGENHKKSNASFEKILYFLPFSQTSITPWTKKVQNVILSTFVSIHNYSIINTWFLINFWNSVSL